MNTCEWFTLHRIVFSCWYKMIHEWMNHYYYFCEKTKTRDKERMRTFASMRDIRHEYERSTHPAGLGHHINRNLCCDRSYPSHDAHLGALRRLTMIWEPVHDEWMKRWYTRWQIYSSVLYTAPNIIHTSSLIEGTKHQGNVKRSRSHTEWMCKTRTLDESDIVLLHTLARV